MKKKMAEAKQPFQRCGSCGFAWDSWESFILDSRIRILGFQAIQDLPDANLLVFEHRCGSSVSILVKRLRHLVAEPSADEGMPTLFDSETCHHFCSELENLEICDRPCANARDRQLIRLILQLKRENP
jgi:hypothetical protein